MKDALTRFSRLQRIAPLSDEALAHLAEQGLALSEDALMRLEETESELLSSYGRFSFGTGPLSLLAKATAPVLSVDAPEASLAILEERFFELRELVPAEISDQEIAEALAEALGRFEGDAAALDDEDTGVLLDLLPDFGEEFYGER